MTLRRSALGVGLAALLVVSVASPAFAYGKATYQVAFSGTGTNPGTGTAFGFWGWCAFAGGVTSGNDGDCEFSQYVHAPGGSGFTCEESLDVSAWHVGPGVFPSGDFIITGTATVKPSAQTAACLALFPGASPFSNVDSQIPAGPGHYNLNSLAPTIFGTTNGEFQIQVTKIP